MYRIWPKNSVDIDNYHDKCQIFISFKIKADFLKVMETRQLSVVLNYFFFVKT